MVPYIVTACIVLALGFVCYRTYSLMQKVTGTPWQRFMAVFQQSGTILYARLGLVLSALSGVATQWASWFGGSPDVQDAIRGLLDPKWIPWYGLVLALILEVVRKRNSAATLVPPIDPTVTTPQPVQLTVK